MKKLELQKLAIQGVGSFIKETEFILNRQGTLTLVKGQNGFGKSTLLASILFILYNIYGKGLSTFKIVTWEELQPKDFKGTRGVLYFKGIDNKQYKIARHIKFKGKTEGISGKSDLLVFIKNGDKYELTDDRHKADKQATINRAMGMDAETFMQSYFFGQSLTRLIENKKEDNQKLFERILEVEWVKRAKENAGVKRNELIKEIELLSKDIDSKEYGINSNKNKIGLLIASVNNFNEAREQRLVRINENIKKIKSYINDTKIDIKANKTLADMYDISKIDILENKIKFTKKDNKEIDILSDKLSEIRDGKIINQLSIELDKVKEDTKLIKDLKSERLNIENKTEQKLKTLRVELREITDLKDDNSYKVTAFEKSLQKYEQETESIKQNIQRLERSIKNVVTTCPTCSQDIPKNQLKITIKKIHLSIEDEQNSLKVIYANKDKIQKDLDLLEGLAKKFDNQYSEKEGIGIELKEGLATELNKLDLAINQAQTEYDIEVQRVKNKYDKEKNNRQSEINKIQRQIQEIESEQGKELQKLNKELAIIIENNREYKKASDNLVVLESELKNYNLSLQNYEQDYENEKITKAPENNIEEIKQEIIEQKKDFDILIEQNKKLVSKLAIVKWWSRTGFGSGGVKAFIFKSGLIRLNKYIKKYASRLGYRVVFSIDMESTYKDFITTVYYTRKMSDGSIQEFEKDYLEFSGGEKQRIALAISFAMEDFVADDVDCNIVIKDEAFEGLDEEGREAAFDLLRLATDKGKAVFVITHSEVIDAKYAKSVYVEKDINGSYIK